MRVKSKNHAALSQGPKHSAIGIISFAGERLGTDVLERAARRRAAALANGHISLTEVYTVLTPQRFGRTSFAAARAAARFREPPPAATSAAVA